MARAYGMRPSQILRGDYESFLIDWLCFSAAQDGIDDGLSKLRDPLAAVIWLLMRKG